jgi:ribonuclease D
MAAARNRPLFKVLGNHTLLAIATNCPTTLDDLGRLPGMSEGQVRRYGRGLLYAVQRGLQGEPVYLPRAPRPDGQFLGRLEALREWRKKTARQWGVESDVILPRDLMQAIAERNPCQENDLAVVMASANWRMEHFGAQIIHLLQKQSPSHQIR